MELEGQCVSYMYNSQQKDTQRIHIYNATNERKGEYKGSKRTPDETGSPA